MGMGVYPDVLVVVSLAVVGHRELVRVHLGGGGRLISFPGSFQA